jgi:hypothetical protein
MKYIKIPKEDVCFLEKDILIPEGSVLYIIGPYNYDEDEKGNMYPNKPIRINIHLIDCIKSFYVAFKTLEEAEKFINSNFIQKDNFIGSGTPLDKPFVKLG